MVTKRGKQAGRKAAARKYGFLEAPLTSFTYLSIPAPIFSALV
ncbi:MAG: hypothetical protein Q8K59_09040 [Nitrosomonas sp.]|nr:hypothetical protein [Nitrosomonas sp.]MDP1951220.1 hypothetical protein [Nitrosomonas sp.]